MDEKFERGSRGEHKEATAASHCWPGQKFATGTEFAAGGRIAPGRILLGFLM